VFFVNKLAKFSNTLDNVCFFLHSISKTNKGTEMEIAIFLAAVAVVLSIIALVLAKKKNAPKKETAEEYYDRRLKSFRMYFTSVYRAFPDSEDKVNYEKMEAVSGKGYITLNENELVIRTFGKDEKVRDEHYMVAFGEREQDEKSFWLRVDTFDAAGVFSFVSIGRDFKEVYFRQKDYARKFVYNPEQISMD
jgi:hypothetical protein